MQSSPLTQNAAQRNDHKENDCAHGQLNDDVVVLGSSDTAIDVGAKVSDILDRGNAVGVGEVHHDSCADFQAGKPVHIDGVVHHKLKVSHSLNVSLNVIGSY